MRAKILRVSVELLVDMCKPTPGTGWCLDCFGLPLDARVHDVRYTYIANTFDIVVISDSFPDVAAGEFIPPIEPAPKFRTIPQPGWADPAA